MLEKVFNYIKDHPSCTSFDIHKALDVPPLAVLMAASELIKRGFIILTTTPSNIPDFEWMAYSTIKDYFVDDSKYCSCKALYSSTIEPVDVGYWDVCTICGKRIQNCFHYYPEFKGQEYDIRLE